MLNYALSIFECKLFESFVSLFILDELVKLNLLLVSHNSINEDHVMRHKVDKVVVSAGTAMIVLSLKTDYS